MAGMSTQKSSTGPTFDPIEQMSYEQARSELAEVVGILELGQMSLDESLAYWERGEALAKACKGFLDGAKQRITAALAVQVAEAEEDDPEAAEEFGED
ncbi:exodeoxyribonuclease VII small subunit [Corynebacterium argentoratense]|uniref:exodeoxyribonuclease VII small subunit n=1 Tax=Corynebacterium argentoratense TaxID=42817 RepID=UPI003C6F9B6F